MRAHELLGIMDPDTQTYREIVRAVKFDIGDRVEELASTSKREFFEIPFSLCLFESNDKIFLAKNEDFGGVSWLRWQYVGGQWMVYDMEFYADSKVFIARRLSTNSLTGGEWIDGGFHNDLDKATPEEKSAIIDFINVASAVEIFSCCNVSTVEHLPPKFINAKRIAKGKVPFFSYRTLHITPDASEALKGKGGGTHASPRLHLRRGHIRQLGDRRVWVRSSLVGDKSKGFAGKDYAVTQTGASNA